MGLIHVDFYTSNSEEFNTSNNERLRVFQNVDNEFEISFYNNTAETNRVDKTNYLTLINQVNGNLREETSLTDLVITIQQSEVPTFNYAFIKSFNRYYYVTDITSVRNNLWEISLSVDVLMTYKEALLNCTGFIDRNESELSPFIVDNKRALEIGEEISTEFITNSTFQLAKTYHLDKNSHCTYAINGMQVGVIKNG